MSTRHALVVGGTSGIGLGIALSLASKGDTVVTIAGRRAQADEIVLRLKELSSLPHKFESVDGFELKTLQKLTAESVDILIMTQEMATIQGYTPTDDGIDQKLQLHYFSRLYLAKLLAPLMKDGSRILTVLSAGVHDRYGDFETDFELKQHYSVKNAADAAGFYTDAGFEKLSECYPNLVVAHAAPGFVNTNWGTEMPWAIRAMIRPLQALFGRKLETVGTTLLTALEKAPVGYSLIDQNGNIMDKSKALKHTREEKDVVWAKTMELLPKV
uniref:Protochlorophyllide reductase n=1 Tax=Timspurckia oligopyrenoides TaxID=708627 RepID=A0A7S0ZHV3_9RHOD|mmetsp:Transcript_5917/g.10492  ORF Transcript_5917/g.10492 Transcript_5917/m.10492 type:complete len:271 (+) Transcript_5917:43-855(+)